MYGPGAEKERLAGGEGVHSAAEAEGGVADVVTMKPVTPTSSVASSAEIETSNEFEVEGRVKAVTVGGVVSAAGGGGGGV